MGRRDTKSTSVWKVKDFRERVVEPTWSGKFRWRMSGSRWRLRKWDAMWSVYVSGGRLIFTTKASHITLRWVATSSEVPIGELLEAIVFSRENPNEKR